MTGRERARQTQFDAALERNAGFAKAWRGGLFMNFNLGGMDAYEIWQAATTVEREACAEIARKLEVSVDEYPRDGGYPFHLRRLIAAAIRARTPSPACETAGEEE